MNIFHHRFIAVVMMLSAMTVSAVERAAPQWSSLDNSHSFIGDNGKTIKASVVTVPLKDVIIRVVYLPFEVKKSSGYTDSSEISLRSFAKALLSHPRYHSTDWIVVNGGFSSYRVDVPAGLLISEGKVYSWAGNETEENELTVISSISYSNKLAGILCQRADNNSWDIIKLSDYRPKLCTQAIQSGPLLINPDNTIGIHKNEPKAKDTYSRTAICLFKDHSVKFIISEPTHLLPLANWLKAPESLGGLGCRVAINMSGSSSSGMALRTSIGKPLSYIGDGSFPLPSALIIEKK